VLQWLLMDGQTHCNSWLSSAVVTCPIGGLT
jgi:hypothetical protein